MYFVHDGRTGTFVFSQRQESVCRDETIRSTLCGLKDGQLPRLIGWLKFLIALATEPLIKVLDVDFPSDDTLTNIGQSSL